MARVAAPPRQGREPWPKMAEAVAEDGGSRGGRGIRGEGAVAETAAVVAESGGSRGGPGGRGGEWRRAVVAASAVAESGGEPRRPWRRLWRKSRGESVAAVTEAVTDKWPATLRV